MPRPFGIQTVGKIRTTAPSNRPVTTIFAAIVSRHSSLEPRWKFDQWSDGGSELIGDQRLNRFGATQLTAELESNSNLTRVQSWTTLVQRALNYRFLKQSPAPHRRHLPAGLRAIYPDFTTKDQWPPNLRNIYTIDYRLYGAMLEAHCSLKQSQKPSPNSRKRFRLSGATCHKDRLTRLWKSYQIKWLKACVGAWSWRWTLRTFTVTIKFWHLIIS